MVSIGHGAPAMMPVRSDDRSCRAKPGSSSMAANIVGTPCSAVQRCFDIELKVSAALKPSPGNTIVAPDAVAHSTPTTMPKQWYSGTGMQSRSPGPSAIALAQ